MTTIVSVAQGGTGANSATLARAALGVPPSAAYDQANTARDQANAAYGQANSARSDANTTFSTINTSFGTVNTSLGTINTNYQAAYAQANTARGTANDAYAAANNSNLKLGGVITGTLNVTQDIIVGGNVYLEGNTTYINVSTYAVEDSLMYLASNNSLTDSVDIGIMGGKNTGGTYSHTGFARDATDGKWKLFDGLPEEGHVGNVVNFANTYLATLVANVEANSITLVGNTVSTQANLTVAHNQANSAYGAANNRVLKAGDTMTGNLTLSAASLVLSSTSNDQRLIDAESTSSTGRHVAFPLRFFVGSAATGYPFAGYNAIPRANGAYSYSGSDTAWGISYGNNSRMGFYYAPYGSAGSNISFSELMVVTSGGSVGIGTTSPATTLHVDASGGGIVRVSRLGTGAGVMQMEADGTDGTLTVTNNLKFVTVGSERMRIDTSGRVLIGATSVLSSPFILQVLGNGTSGARTAIIGGPDVNTSLGGTAPILNLYNSNSTQNNFTKLAFGGTNTTEGVSINCENIDHTNGYGNMVFVTRGSTGYAERMRITSRGAVLVGTSSDPTGSAVQHFFSHSGDLATALVVGDAANTAAISGIYIRSQDPRLVRPTNFPIHIADPAGTKHVTIMGTNNGGRVGIGATSPNMKLEIADLSLGSAIDSVKDFIRLATTTTNNDYLDFFKLRDSDGGTDWTSAGWRIQQKIDNTWMGWMQFNGVGNLGGLAFGTGLSATSQRSVTERVRIDSSGNVGIGTTSPRGKLEVDNIYIGTAGVNHGFIRSADGVVIDTDYDNSGGDGFFEIRNSGSTRLYITDGGNLGIGTNNPQGKLTISNAGAEGIEFFTTGGVGGGSYFNAYNRSAGRYVPFTYYANTHTFYTNTGSTRVLDLTVGGSVGIGTASSDYAKVHIRESGITAAAISTGWPAYNAETATQSKYVLHLDAGSNGSVTSQGQGPSAVLLIGNYYDSRGIITMLGAGGGSPSDGGTGYGKDLMVKAGNSDNGNGFTGGRLYLAGGSGYNGGAFGTLYGSVILQPQGGSVGISTSPNTFFKLDINGRLQANGWIDVSGDGSSGYVGSRLILRTHSNYRGAGMYLVGETSAVSNNTFYIGTPYTDHSYGILFRYTANNYQTDYQSAAYTAAGTTLMWLAPSGAVSIPGSLSKGSGSFKIDHPLPEKANSHFLVHSFIEGPQADLIYRGRANLVNGIATVNIDTAAGMTEGTFILLCRDVQCFTSNETDWDNVRGYVDGNILTIECQNPASNSVISWMVIGERQDKHMYDTEWTDEIGKVIVEPEKPEIVTLEEPNVT